MLQVIFILIWTASCVGMCRAWYLMGFANGRLLEIEKNRKTLEIIRDLDSPDPAIRADAEQRAKFYEIMNVD